MNWPVEIPKKASCNEATLWINPTVVDDSSENHRGKREEGEEGVTTTAKDEWLITCRVVA